VPSVAGAAREFVPVADDKFKIFSGTSNAPLADEICGYLGVERGRTVLGKFSDGEIYFQILENVRGANVFVVQPCSQPADFHLMELLLMIDAFKRASAWRITAVVPYYCYARQDRKDKTASADLGEARRGLAGNGGREPGAVAGPAWPQIQGYFNVPVDHVYASPVMVEHFRQLKHAETDRGFTGCRRRGAGAGICKETGCAAGHRGQAPRGYECGGSDASDRRCARQDDADCGRHH